MIISNKDRFLAGSRYGVIQNRSFRCALVTDSLSAVVSTFTQEWDSKNHHPVAEAVLPEALPRKQVREIHDAFLKELDECGTSGLDLAGAIERVFGRARNENMITRYQNNAAILLPANGSSSEGSLKRDEPLHSFIAI